jgi:hypothetical protein
MLIAEVCALVDRWAAAEEQLFVTAGEASSTAPDPRERVGLAEVSRHAGARALRWRDLRPVVPVVPVPAADPGVLPAGPVALLDELVAAYGQAMREAEPASDGPLLAVLRVAALEVAGDRRRLDH